jgi:tetratricopeptide (TPR) repeat protein
MRSVDQLLSRARQAQAELRLSDARNYLAEAITLPRNHEQALQLIELLKGVGRVERDAGNLEVAQASYQQAAAICESECDALLFAHTLRNVGDILAQRGDVVGAREKCWSALQIYRVSQDAPALDVANAIRSCALLEEQVDHAAAIPLWQEAKGLYASAGVLAGVEECNRHLDN